MSDLTWKPGPPPISVPGTYVFKAENFHNLALVKAYHDRTCSAYDDVWHRITHHFPIPSPPSGEQE